MTYLDDGPQLHVAYLFLIATLLPPLSCPCHRVPRWLAPRPAIGDTTRKQHPKFRNGLRSQELHGFVLCWLACQGAPPSRQGRASVPTTLTTHSLAPLVPRRCRLMLQRPDRGGEPQVSGNPMGLSFLQKWHFPRNTCITLADNTAPF